MNRQGGSRGINSPVLAVMAVYGLVVSAEPTLHHDFFSNQHSPARCISCMSSQCAPVVEPGSGAVATWLPPAGTSESCSPPIVEMLTPELIRGRSPPA